MTKDEYCKKRAAVCLRLAQDSTNPSDKAMLLQMAEAWQELAEKAARRDE